RVPNAGREDGRAEARSPGIAHGTRAHADGPIDLAAAGAACVLAATSSTTIPRLTAAKLARAGRDGNGAEKPVGAQQPAPLRYGLEWYLLTARVGDCLTGRPY